MRVGPYELLERLGQGGMGEVWRARHVELGAERALKRTLQRGAQHAARFEREARALALVRHPSVVAVHEVGREPDGTAWLAMELLEGVSLDRLLAGGALPLARALEVGAQLARGLEALHAAGVVHRDLKPANVVVVRQDGRAVLLDLGVALAADERERLTRTGALVGTPAYMAPEQLAGGEAGPASDVHGLGLVLFELVTGRAAREGLDLVTLARTRAAARPSALEPALAGGLPAALDDLVAACTDPDPARRPTAEALAVALEALTRAPGPSARTRRLWRLVAGLAVALVAVGGIGALVLAPGSPGPAPQPATAQVAQVAPSGPAPSEAPSEAEAPTEAVHEALAAARRLAPAPRREALVAWLGAHPGDPARPEAEALLAPLLRDAPRWTALRPDARTARFVGPDLVAVGDGRSVELLDAGSGASLGGVVLPANKVEALAVGAHPGADRRPFVLVATIGPNGLVLVDPAARTATRLPWSQLLTPDDVVVSRDGQRALVRVRDSEPRVVTLPGGEPQLELGPHDGPVSCAVFDAEGRILTGSTSAQEGLGGSSLSIWSPAGALVHRLATLSRTTAAAPIAGTARLVVATSGGQLLLVDAAAGTADAQLLGDDLGDQLRAQRAHLAAARRIVTSLDGARAVSSAADSKALTEELAVWDLRREALVRRLVRPRATGRAPTTVERLDLDATGRALLVTDSAGAVERWDLGD